MAVIRSSDTKFDFTVPVVVIGGGGCGLTAALSAREHGADVLVLERDSSALGTTAMSTGLIPGAGSRYQREKGIEDSPALFAEDIMRKTKGQTDPDIALALAEESARTVEWLADEQGLPLSLVDSFLYPGHSAMRMHGTPHRTGSELMGGLSEACGAAGADILLDAPVTDLFADSDNRIRGVRVTRPDGAQEEIGCETLILACCGFGGNREMLEEYIPEIVPATFFGHPGNKGDAISWGRELGAAVADIHSYQGHGGLAYGQGIPILWPLIMEGGFQVNANGERFSNESRGYSEQAVDVVAQPGHFVWDIYDARLHDLMKEFDDYQDAIKAGCIVSAGDVEELAVVTKLPLETLAQTVSQVEALVAGEAEDEFGRDFKGKGPLEAPYYAVKVTGALFHTQGGLAVDSRGRVLAESGMALPNLFAGGGAARGISGPSSWGYMAGNGLLTATTFGRLSGETAAKQAT